MKITIRVPIEVEIIDPIAALNTFATYWGADLDNPNEISPLDLILHAGDLGITVNEDEIDLRDARWLYENGHPDEDVMLTRDELANE